MIIVNYDGAVLCCPERAQHRKCVGATPLKGEYSMCVGVILQVLVTVSSVKLVYVALASICVDVLVCGSVILAWCYWCMC